MEYHPNPLAWERMFAVPCEIVDEHIRLAGSVQLKVLLYMLRHVSDSYTLEDISNALGIDSADIRDALQYWCAHDILYKVDEKTNLVPLKKENEAVKKVPVAPQQNNAIISNGPSSTDLNIPIVKPDQAQVNARLAENPDLRHLYAQVQAKFGRTIGYNDQATLLMIHDHYGLPVEVILMILNYAVSINKGNLNYMRSVAKDWAKREIITLEAAEQELEQLANKDALWKEFRQKTGLENKKPTARQAEFLETWHNDWGFSMNVIYLAYEIMTENTRRLSFPYMNKILENWRSQGLITIAQIQRDQQERKKAYQKETTPSNTAASYDLDAFMDNIMKTSNAKQQEENK